MEEVEQMWAEVVGLGADEEVDEATFVKFWEAVDDLFEDEVSASGCPPPAVILRKTLSGWCLFRIA